MTRATHSECEGGCNKVGNDKGTPACSLARPVLQWFWQKPANKCSINNFKEEAK
jgi:hypothetical protein